MVFIAALAAAVSILRPVSAFEGRITATVTRGGDAHNLVYTVGTNFLRIERLETDRPYACDIVNLQSGELTLLFPNNRSFVRLKPAAEGDPAGKAVPAGGIPPGIGAGWSPGSASVAAPGMPQRPAMPQMAAVPGIPPSVGRQSAPGAPAMPQMPRMPQMPQMPPGAPAMPAMPAMPMMPMMPMQQAELKATSQTTNLLGFLCAGYELKQRGETMEIWATDQLLPFQPYVENQPHRFGPQMLEEQWAGMLKDKKLFPVLATLKTQSGMERYRFEIKTITPDKLEPENMKLFLPPPDYQEIQPLPF